MTIKAQRLVDEGNLDYALTVLEESIKQNPNYGNNAYFLKINTLIRKNALGEALEETSKLAKFDKTKASWYLLRALIHKKSGNSKAELSDYKRSLESAKTYIAQGKVYLPYNATTDYEAAAYAAEKLGKLEYRDMLLKKYFDTYSKPEKTDLNKHLFLEKKLIKKLRVENKILKTLTGILNCQSVRMEYKHLSELTEAGIRTKTIHFRNKTISNQRNHVFRNGWTGLFRRVFERVFQEG